MIFEMQLNMLFSFWLFLERAFKNRMIVEWEKTRGREWPENVLFEIIYSSKARNRKDFFWNRKKNIRD